MPIATPPTLISARVAGLMYLAIIGLGLFGEVFVRAALVVGGDVAATATNILAAEQLWRTGIATDLVMHVLDVPLIVFFYLLLKPVSHPLALLATAFNIVQTCVLAANKLTLVAALSLLKSAGMSASLADAQALASLAINLHGYGFGIGLIFFGFTCVLRGYLIVRSGYVPRVLGVLLVVAGIGYLVNSFALLVAPRLAAIRRCCCLRWWPNWRSPSGCCSPTNARCSSGLPGPARPRRRAGSALHRAAEAFTVCSMQPLWQGAWVPRIARLFSRSRPAGGAAATNPRPCRPSCRSSRPGSSLSKRSPTSRARRRTWNAGSVNPVG